MAEALGLTASVIGVLQLTGKLVSLGYDYIGGAIDAAKDIRRLLDELHSLSNVLLILQDCARDDKGLRFTALKTLSDQAGPLYGCKLELQRLQLKLEPRSGLRGKIQELIWPLKEKETSQFVARLERHKSLFNLALTADQLTLVRAIELYAQDTNLMVHHLQTESKLIGGCVRDTNNVVHDLLVEASAQNAWMQREDILQTARKRESVLNWLYSEDFDRNHLEICSRRQENTGNWLLQTPAFQEWLNGNPDFMLIWGHGIPGAGKTFLSSRVIDYLFWKAQTLKTNYGVAYVYFDYTSRNQQKPIRVLASLVKQLASQSPLFYAEAEKFYEKLSMEGVKKKPTFQELYATLIAAPESFDRVFLIFDALDECDPNTQRKELLPLFSRLAKDINVFVTSRPHPEDIRISLCEAIQIELLAKEEDIETYIQQVVDNNPRAKRLIGQGQCKEMIISGLADCAKGMFLLVRFHIEHICQQPTVRRILTELQGLKNSSGEERPLDPTYRRVMNNILSQPRHCRELALNALSWLVKARRTLTVEELREAVSVELNRYELDEWDLPDETTLLDVCASLITIDKNTGTIRLAHYSVQEYLLRNSIPLDAGFRVAMTCITYLSFDIFARDISESSQASISRPHLFLNYAANQLSVHLKACDESSTADALIYFLENPGNIESYVQTMEICGHECQNPECHPECGYNYQGRTPLHIASSLGHFLVAEYFLKKGADISARDECGYTALHEATFRGHYKLVQLLLESGADISARGRSGWTVLHLAVCGGHYEVARLLLENGADISAKSQDKWTALHTAAHAGHHRIIRLLLENGADTSHQNEDGETALHKAAYGGHDKIIQLLLENGADTSIQARKGRTALFLAAGEGHYEAAQRLLEHGAYMPTPRIERRETLNLTTDRGWEKFVQLLLENGANFSYQGGEV